jgi:integrase/recombinase XerD
VLSVQEVEQVLMQPDIHDPMGLRDRAILETLYSTGIRRGECVRLKLYDADLQNGTVFIRQGKGKKDRYVPIGERAVKWIEKYLREVRPDLAVEPDDMTLFLSQYGDAFSPDHLSGMVHDYIEAANLGKGGGPHLLRHTMATLMLENGADLRFIQEILGHEKISTTQIYAHVSIRQLKLVHEHTHPAEQQPEGAAAQEAAKEAAREAVREATPAADAQARAELLAALAADDAEDNEGSS